MLNFPLTAGQVVEQLEQRPDLFPQELRKLNQNGVNDWRTRLPSFLYSEDGQWRYSEAAVDWIVFGTQLRRYAVADKNKIQELFGIAVNVWGGPEALAKMKALYDPCQGFRPFLHELEQEGIKLPPTLEKEAAEPL